MIFKCFSIIIKYEFPFYNQRRETVAHEKHVLVVCLALTNQEQRKTKRDEELCE